MIGLLYLIWRFFGDVGNGFFDGEGFLVMWFWSVLGRFGSGGIIIGRGIIYVNVLRWVYF